MWTTHSLMPQRVGGRRGGPWRGRGAGPAVAHAAPAGPPRREARAAPEERVQDA
ncbi:hypothetical protein Snoj_24740 [Streptomyces nojiriensis]|uniref:Uncharacterized protein n=1 Tax=Streptomyces nojiriensis TaxID=66374 RepID=A0ABQ3SK92_9ACTN|nr:hypothetical protein GCM10010205_61510 [Streptomyces nojiriensis]GHI68556.1 hypothetical protein Snoj_24740 [Streptomyces nojiriensis]